MKGYIYQLISNNTNRCYIGSTKRTPHRRMKEHMNDAKKKRENKYTANGICKAYNVIEDGNVSMNILFEGEFESDYELRIKEEEFRSSIECINQRRAFQRAGQQQQYYRERYQQKKEQILAQQKIRYEEKRDEILLKQKVKYQKNKDMK